MQTTSSAQAPSAWQDKLAALGPGILLASAAVGGSHLVASTQAGALYGWQLLVIIVLVNVFKYPFFRFSTHYSLRTGKSLVEGYAECSRVYVWLFFLLMLFSSAVSTGAMGLVSAAIIKMALPDLAISMPILTTIVTLATLAILLFGHYRVLDKLTKAIMISLSCATVMAVVIAASHGSHVQPDFVPSSPWQMASFGFIVALMGWMPMPMEASAISSMWVVTKQRLEPTSYRNALFDFNIGYWGSTILAVVFLALGALVQYGNGVEVKLAGNAYIGQLIEMYAATIGGWSRLLVAFIAFACMFGTALTVADGYGRVNAECLRIIMRQKQHSSRAVALWTCWALFLGLVIVLGFKSAMGEMLRFAMMTAFLIAPFVALLNYRLVRHMKNEDKISAGQNLLAILGLIYLFGFSLVFVLNLAGVLG